MSETPAFDATVRAFVADEVDRLFAPLREAVGLVNPLAYDVDDYCPTCSTFLRSGNLGGRERCPMGCGEAS
jgi:hypothetical protein